MSALDLAQFSNAMVYGTMVVLALAMIAFAISFSRSRTTVATGAGSVMVDDSPQPQAAGNVAMALTWLAFGLLTAGVIARGIWAGRVPWGNMYEFSISSALGILGVFLFFSLKRDVRWLGLFVVIPALLTLGLAVTVLYTEAAQLVPALKSYWLIIHVSAAIVCGGAFTVAAGTAGLSLVRDRWSAAAALPSTQRLQTLTYRLLAFAFPLWTFAVISGAIWAENAWGRYWGWDPKETWAFITWVVYAAYLHARSTAGWRGTRATWIAIIGWVTFLINYFGVNLFVTSLHSYSGV
jgi:cytochrome c-type biogenesis protein CcsB